MQNYYIYAFEKYAASAITAGALFRSFIGCVVLLLTPLLLDKIGVAWGMSVLGFISVALVGAEPVVVSLLWWGIEGEIRN